MNKTSSLAVLLLSSGLDSAANLVLGDFKVQLALSIDYGQLGAVRELERAEALCRHFGVEHVILNFRAFSELIGSTGALITGRDIPQLESLEDIVEARQTAKAVWVPNRNSVFLSLAAALAESRGFDQIAVGFNAEEAATFPDNTVDYMEVMTQTFKFSTANHVRVVSATAEMSKVEIVQKLSSLNFPFELIWSCYRGGEKHCGTCESCQRLRRAMTGGLPETYRSETIKRIFG